ncbi:DUF211 domain-containing protein [Halorussus salinus]|uniref:DUF211 domain-containing protein n=1 Tax=Halorussus salinus TaxID=1364935 RepID=UPI00109273A1|nr:DUF211 domain-containing protein [Halorussus salinus]
MPPVRRVVADVLKPHQPSLADFVRQMAAVEGVEGATATLVERDEEVQNVKVTAEGEEVSPEQLESAIEDIGGSLHSVDEVSCGEYVVEERPTPQD